MNRPKSELLAPFFACVRLGLALSLLVGCAVPLAEVGTQPANKAPAIAAPVAKVPARPARPLLNPAARLQTRGQSLALDLSWGAGFKTSALNCGEVAFARVSVTCPGIADPIYAVGADGDGLIRADAGCRLRAALSEVPYGLRIIKVELFDASRSLIPTSEIGTALWLDQESRTVELSYRQFPLARVLEILIAGGIANEVLATELDLEELQAFIDQVTGVEGDFPDYLYQAHPSRVDMEGMVAAIVFGAFQSPQAYILIGATVDVSVSGLLGDDLALVNIGDAGSESRTFGNYTTDILAITPGDGLDVNVSTAEGAGTSYSFNLTDDSLDLANGDRGTLSIVAVPATLTLTPLGQVNVSPGESLTLTGSGFHTAGATTVTIGGESAEILRVSPNALTVTVPSLDPGVHDVVVEVGDQSESLSVTVLRYIHVNDDVVGGLEDGSSWANAYRDLQDALDAAEDGDIIKVAEGTYTPGTSRGDSFELAAGVTLYGGFADSNPVSDPADRDLAAHVSVLSGDLGTAGDYSDNSYHVLRDSDGAVIDGVTIAYGHANGTSTDQSGAGMLINASSPTLRQVRFESNRASGQGGAVWARQASSPIFEDVVFYDNRGGNGGAMYNDESSPSLRRVLFLENQSGFDGGGMVNYFSNASLDEVVFQGNTAANFGGGMYNGASSEPTLSNVVFTGNSAAIVGGGVCNTGNQMTLSQVTFYDNSAVSNGAGMMHFVDALTPVSPRMANVLFVDGGYTSNLGLPSGGNFSLVTDPFVDSADPDGDDNRWFSADDGLRLSSDATAVLDQGIDSDPDIPLAPNDILGVARPLTGRDPGAYEGGFEE